MLSNGDDHCLQILSLSYTHLLDHMKKCFLYTGIYPEDSHILVSRVVKLWVAEGFIEPLSSNGLMEDIAYETLLDLIGRSLLLVDERSSTGKIKTCKIHDLVRDFCIKEAKSEMLFHITDTSLYGIPVDAKIPLCLSIHLNKKNIVPCDIKKLLSLEVSSLHNFDPTFHYLVHHLNRQPLRVLDMGKSDCWIRCTQWEPNEFLSHNLRYLSFNPLGSVDKLSIPSSSVLPKLQTLILHGSHRTYELPSIWNMAQVRHVKTSKSCLSEPLERENSAIVLENLQTLSQVYNFKLSKDVLGRIPNLKKLKIIYRFMKKSNWQHHCLENLMCLQKLEALTCTLVGPCPPLLHILTFPPSLQKLTLQECGLPWKDVKIVGSLPNLKVLKLRSGSFLGKEWECESTAEEFPKLKFFMLEHLLLELWTVNIVNFPGLQRLIIRYCTDLVEIPRCIGEIPMLQLIELRGCCDSLRDLVTEMQDEQLEYGNDGLEACIIHW